MIKTAWSACVGAPPRQPLTVDVLRSFYTSPVGRRFAQQLAQRLVQWWPESVRSSLRIMGFGYPLPVFDALRCHQNPAIQTWACIPEAFGNLVDSACEGQTPNKTPNKIQGVSVTLDALPLADESVDRAVILHGLDCLSDDSRAVFTVEVMRVLACNGKAILVIPSNAWGILPASTTPFARIYTQSLSGIIGLCTRAGLSITRRTCVRGLPFTLPFMGKNDGLCARQPLWGSVTVIEFCKTVYNPTLTTQSARIYAPKGRRRVLLVPACRSKENG